MRGYTDRHSLRDLWKRLVRDVLASLAQWDPADLAADRPARVLEYDQDARRIVRRLLRQEATSVALCELIVLDELHRRRNAAIDRDALEGATGDIWERWVQILRFDDFFARWDAQRRSETNP